MPESGPREVGRPQSGASDSASFSVRMSGMAMTALPTSLASHSSRLRIMQPQAPQSKLRSSSSMASIVATLAAISLRSFFIVKKPYSEEGFARPRAFTRRSCWLW